MTDDSQFLPGLEPARPDTTNMERAALAQLQKLADSDLLNDSHAMVVQAVRDLARVVGMAAARGQAAGMALAAKELREYLALLPVAAVKGDPFDEFAARLGEMSGQPT